MELNHTGVLKKLPDRQRQSHKGDFGRILLLCGSVGFTGAAALAAMGALRSGAGLVYLGVPESIYAIEAIKLNEPVVFPLPETNGKFSESAFGEVQERLSRMDAVLIGPGMGQSPGTLALVQNVLKEFTGPVVLDADGINVLSEHKDVLRERVYPTIITPHEGEFIQFGGKLAEGRQAGARAMAQELGVIVVLKGSGTVITDGVQVLKNPTGNPGMAVGGSGDVLAGIIVSLLGQGLSPLDAAGCGVWLHGAAGDICAGEIGQYGMLPTDMIQVLPRLMK